MAEKSNRYLFLDGIRGLAAIFVICGHTSNFHWPEFNIFTQWASPSVPVFFALSSFLLQYRFLKDWHKLKTWRQQNPNATYLWEGLELFKYLIRRVMRIIPLYFLVASFACLTEFGQDAYFRHMYGRLDWWQHITMQRAVHVFWTIPVEFQYYMVMPIFGIVYYFASRFDLGDYGYRKAPRLHSLLVQVVVFSAWFGIMLGYAHYSYMNQVATPSQEFYHIKYWYGVFFQGSFFGAIFFEIDEAHLLPDKVKKRQTKRLSGIILHYLPTLFDILAWCLLFGNLMTSWPHYSLYFPDWYINQPKSYFGIWFGLIFIFALMSEGTFCDFFSWFFMTYAGKISYSMYLLHPVAIRLFFFYFFKDMDYRDVSHDPSNENNFFDKFVLVLGISWVLGTISYHLVEQPSLYACRVILNLLPKPKKQNELNKPQV
ncbi:acyltransferase 3 [Gorgonomyces haynaldii]|nr:acyltransferase 3 [Gorgonomyces haynaldii]